jgi:hypothetical protein
LISIAGFLESAGYHFLPMGSISMHLFCNPFSWAPCRTLGQVAYWSSLLAAPWIWASDPALSLTNRIAFTRQHIDIRTVFQANADAPITVQTMTNTPTSDAGATIDQIRRAEEVGVDIVRVSCPDEESTAALKQIVRAANVVAD